MIICDTLIIKDPSAAGMPIPSTPEATLSLWVKKKVYKTELAATLTYGDQNDKDNNIYYRILKTTFYEGGPEEITGLHTEALGVLFPVDSMDSCEEMMIQDWPGALYKKDDTAFLCWTYSPEVTYVLEYTPSKIDDSEIIKMAESAEPVK